MSALPKFHVIEGRNFEIFQGRLIKARPSISVTRNRQFTFNESTFLSMGKPKAVILSYDRTNRLIKLEPSQQDVRGAYSVNKQAHTKAYIVTPWAFFSHFDIKIEVTLKCAPEFDEQSAIIDLASGFPTGKNRKSKGEPPQ
jgi:hypothetical protein